MMSKHWKTVFFVEESDEILEPFLLISRHKVGINFLIITNVNLIKFSSQNLQLDINGKATSQM